MADCGISSVARATRGSHYRVCRARQSSWTLISSVRQTGGGALRVDIGANRTRTGTINALIVDYYKSAAFTEELTPETQRMRRNILERFRADHGDKRAALLQQGHIDKILRKEAAREKELAQNPEGPDGVRHRGRIRADNPCKDVNCQRPQRAWGT